jgi:putative hydrolase of the HAD superfamily
MPRSDREIRFHLDVPHADVPHARAPDAAVEAIRGRSTPRAPIPTDLAFRCELTTPIRAVLFDVYGTLFVSGSGDVGTARKQGDPEHFARAVRDVVPRLLPLSLEGTAHRDLGVAARDAYFEEIARSHDTSRQAGVDHPEVDVRTVWKSVCKRLTERGFLRALPDAEQIELLAVSYELESNPTWPMPEAEEALARLRGAGIPLGIVSNAQFFTPLLFEALLHATIRELGFDEELCVYSYQEGRAKPSEKLFGGPLSRLRAAYGILPGEVLYVGNDMKNDIRTAERAGCKACLFAGDRRSLRVRAEDSEAARTRPDAVITTLGELDRVLSLGGTSHA